MDYDDDSFSLVVLDSLDFNGVACNKCEICSGVEGSESIDLDCSNVEPEASTGGCTPFESSSAENLFPTTTGRSNEGGGGGGGDSGSMVCMTAAAGALAVAGLVL